MLPLAELLPADLLNAGALPAVIAYIRAQAWPRASKRYVLGEWARQMGVKLEPGDFDELRGGPEIVE